LPPHRIYPAALPYTPIVARIRECEGTGCPTTQAHTLRNDAMRISALGLQQ
jgi:hypothetical protein